MPEQARGLPFIKEWEQDEGLREQIADTLWDIGEVDLTRKRGFTEAYLRKADQIIALARPIIEKQERERIITFIKQYPFHAYGSAGDKANLLQALEDKG